MPTPIKHLVVLMLENRSFDHMLGFMKSLNPAIDGLNGDELRGINIHMQSEDPDQPLVFDFRVKPRISRQTNALAIVRLMGISV